MKPVHFGLTTLASTAALAVVGTAVIPSLADSRPVALPSDTWIAALPAATDRLWVKVRHSISLEDLATQLAQDESKLARLNEVDEDHRFSSGDWLVLPSQSIKQAKQLAGIDTSELRRTPPLDAPPEPQEPGRVRFGDSLIKIAQRYNLSINELLQLNPGLRAARLVVGTQIRLAQSSPGRSRMLLGLKPVGSGGLSWPDSPDFGLGEGSNGFGGGQPFADTGWIWPTQGVFSSGYGWRWGRMHKGIDMMAATAIWWSCAMTMAPSVATPTTAASWCASGSRWPRAHRSLRWAAPAVAPVLISTSRFARPVAVQ